MKILIVLLLIFSTIICGCTGARPPTQNQINEATRARRNFERVTRALREQIVGSHGEIQRDCEAYRRFLDDNQNGVTVQVEMPSPCTEVANLRREIENLHQTLANKDEEITRLTGQVRLKEDEINAKQQEIQTLRQTNETLQQERDLEFRVVERFEETVLATYRRLIEEDRSAARLFLRRTRFLFLPEQQEHREHWQHVHPLQVSNFILLQAELTCSDQDIQLANVVLSHMPQEQQQNARRPIELACRH